MPVIPEAVRDEIIDACRVLDAEGLVRGFGHVSARLDDGSVAITPRKALALVRPDELLQMELDGVLLHGASRPALETAMHLAVFRRRPEVRAICRTHSKYVNVLGLLGRPVRVVHGFGTELRGPVEVFPVPLLVDSRQMGDQVAAALGSAHGLILRGNGCLVVGDSVGDACAKAIFLEESAELQVIAATLGEVPALPPEQVRVRLESDLPNEPVRAWEYYRAVHGVTAAARALRPEPAGGGAGAGT